MLLTITAPEQLRRHGWTQFPEYVTASHNLWRRWKQGYESNRKSVMIRDKDQFRPASFVDINGMRFSIVNNVVQKVYLSQHKSSPAVPGMGAKIINGLMFYYENNTLTHIERRNAINTETDKRNRIAREGSKPRSMDLGGKKR